MKNPLALIIILTITKANADSIYEQADCRKTESDAKIEIYANGALYQLENNSKTCDRYYSFIDSGDGSMVILAGPSSDELGINAQNEVYLATSGSRKAIYIGSVPVRSDFIENKTFRDIAQVGGSLFETIYIIKDGKLTTAYPGYEFIFSDEQCIYNNEKSKKCTTLTGTYENPICAWQSGERKLLAKKERCEDLRDNIDSRLGK
ncbi:hypothetical protein IB256_20545 [Pseudomonas sp. PDM17]|uniref:hypothetical protein n=1 Tax=Pseudomonas sp. PDM17 TaxID=2769285 RepID=UPI001782D13A|nr:hypothetical protein [Pseudomonas sp. PDM17]MBD9503190.1 hypothetical protein [Pseudomonas sp. PDM17]